MGGGGSGTLGGKVGEQQHVAEIKRFAAGGGAGRVEATKKRVTGQAEQKRVAELKTQAEAVCGDSGGEGAQSAEQGGGGREEAGWEAEAMC